MFGRYTPDDFDKHGYLKAPISLYLLLLLLLRAYVIWLLSVANFSNTEQLIEFFYPNKQTFIFGLLSGAAALLVLILHSLRRPKAYKFTAQLWRYGQWLLWLAVLTDIGLTLWQLSLTHFRFVPQTALILLALSFAVGYLWRSQRLPDLFADWPTDSYQSVPSS